MSREASLGGSVRETSSGEGGLQSSAARTLERRLEKSSPRVGHSLFFLFLL